MGKNGFRAIYSGLTSAALLFASTAAQALPGDLDLEFGGFGTSGQIQETGQDASDVAIDAQGRLVIAGTVAGSFHVQRRSGARFLGVEDIVVSFPGQQASSATAVAIGPSGKIVLAGTVRLSGQDVFGIARLDPDLSPDPTFADGDGLLTSPPDGSSLSVSDVAVQSDGRIVVVGDFLVGPDREIAVLRFNEDGTPDLSFDGEGKLTFSGAGAASAAVAIQADGQILVAGAMAQQSDLVVIRLNSADGSPDTSFSEDGNAVIDFGEVDETAADIAIAADGKIVVAGTGSESNRILVARLFPDGQPDPDFGGTGQVTTTIPGGSSAAESVVVQLDSKIVVGGQAVLDGSPGAFVLIRYNVDGSPDDAFGEPGSGTVITPFGTTATAVAALALQADGMLVAVGGGQAARYRWNGSLDVGGIAALAFNPQQTRGEVTGLAVDGDGRLVAAGTVRVGDFNMAVARFAADYREGLDLTFGIDEPKAGRTMFGMAGQNEEVQALAIGADGKPVVAGQAYSTGPTRLMVGRLDVDGRPDPQCTTVGFTSISFGFGNDAARAVALTPDRIYAAGRVIGPEDFDYGLARFTPACTVDTFGNPPVDYRLALEIDGPDFLNGLVYQPATDRPVLAGISGGDIVLTRIFTNNAGMSGPDTTFGINGYATLDVGANESVAGIAVQSDGKLIVAGSVANDFYVTRLTADGDVDTTFGTASITVADLGGIEGAFALAVRADDSIAVVGSSFSSEPMRTVFAVAQFTPDGLSDPGFGEDGKAAIAFGADGVDVGQAVTFVGPDRLVVGGFAVAAGNRRFALAALETTVEGPTSRCTGDCDGDGQVLVDELLTMISIALGTSNVSACLAGDADGNSQITVDELVTAVNNALNGCPVA